MSIAIVTCGPRGAGKTTYCQKIKCDNTELISRDEIATTLYGKTWFNPFFEFMESCNVQEKFFEQATEKANQKDITILDIWNPTKHHRAMIINKIKLAGFDRVICWYFTTPLDKCVEWFFQKDDVKIGGYTQKECIYDFHEFHKNAQSIYTDGFDEVVEINPLII